MAFTIAVIPDLSATRRMKRGWGKTGISSLSCVAMRVPRTSPLSPRMSLPSRPPTSDRRTSEKGPRSSPACRPGLIDSLDDSGVGRKEYLIVCLAAAFAGAPTYGASGAALLSLCAFTGAPRYLAAGVGLFAAALLDLGRISLLPSDVQRQVVPGGELLGIAVYVLGFATVFALRNGFDDDTPERERAETVERVGMPDDRLKGASDLETSRTESGGSVDSVLSDTEALRDWDTRLQGDSESSGDGHS